MAARLTADEMRGAMAVCLRELQDRLTNEKGPDADERLAGLITTYIGDEFKEKMHKFSDVIEETVVDCVTEKLKSELFLGLFAATMGKAAPKVAQAAAVTAVKDVPLKVAMAAKDGNAEFLFPEIGEQSIAQTIILICQEHVKLKDQMSATHTMLGELVTLVSNDGGKVKVFTAEQPTDPTFTRRTDVEEATAPPLSKAERVAAKKERKYAKRAAKQAAKGAPTLIATPDGTIITPAPGWTADEITMF